MIEDAIHHMPVVSVIIPVYQTEAYLESCLHSVVHQTYQNLEILLIDDGSTDHCPEICDAWARKDPRIQVIHQSNGGLSDARNTGLRHAHGELIAFIDSDDWIALDMIEKMTDTMLRHHADMVICQYVTVFEDGHSESHYKKRGSEEILTRHQALTELLLDMKITNHVCRKLYWRQKIPQDVFPKRRSFEDIYAMPLLMEACEKIVYLPDVFYFYRSNPSGIVHSSEIKNLEDHLWAREQATQKIKAMDPELEKEAQDSCVRIQLDLWIYSAKKLPIDQRVLQLQEQLREKLKGQSIRSVRILGPRKMAALLLIQYCPLLARTVLRCKGRCEQAIHHIRNSSIDLSFPLFQHGTQSAEPTYPPQHRKQEES